MTTTTNRTTTGTSGTSGTRWTVIKASAGSGKTYRLTELLTDRLSRTDNGASDGAALRPSQIIATTFTRAAAAELKDRIRDGLVDRGLLSQAAALPTALIGTVNSVTGRILTDFALDAGRSPDLQILTEQSEKTAFTLATDQVIAEAEETHRDLLARTGYDGDGDRGFYATVVNWADTIRAVTGYARANNIPASRLPDFAEAGIAELTAVLDDQSQTAEQLDTRALLAGAARSLPETLAAEEEPSTAKRRPIHDRLDALRAFGRRVDREYRTLSWPTWLKVAEGKIPGVKGSKPIKRISETYGAVVTAEQILADPALRTDLADLTRLVFTTAADCLTAYADYKDALGLIDFTDQEQLTLRLLRGEGVDAATAAAVRETLAARYRILVVDEFQDTSPLQLALFTELAQLVEEVIWVGDPKQSIYGFRGSDPALMDEAVRTITTGVADGGLGGTAETLRFSYRTRQAPLDLSNRLFGRLFADPESGSTDDVVLTVPAVRATEYAADGDLADGETLTWPHDEGRPTKAAWYDRIAEGLTGCGAEPVEAGRVPARAVLVRNNTHAAELRATLRDHGIACSGAGAPLAETREGQLTAAAVAWLLDDRDTQSLVELVCLLPDHAAHHTWFDELTAADPDTRSDVIKRWAGDRVLAPLAALRGRLPELAVPELTAGIVDALDLRGRVAATADPATRTGSVLGVLQAAADYTAEQESAGLPATATGFHAWLVDEETVTSPVPEPGAVEIQTVHRAKGLEWDTVVVALPDAREHFTPAGVWVQSDRALSMTDPLAGRQIRFWPETLLAHSGAKEALSATGVQAARRRTDLLEEQRLLYVAMTRSKFRTVLAPYSSVGAWRALTEAGVDEEELADLTRDSARLPQSPAPVAATPAVSPAAVLDRARTEPPVDDDIVPATFAPSGAVADEDLAAGARVSVRADLGAPLVTGGGEEWNKVGDCIHSYLAAPLGALSADQRITVATRLVTRWGVGDRVTPEQVVACGDRWSDYVTGTLGATAVASEVPFTWTNRNDQRAQGWLDQLLTVPGNDGGGGTGDTRAAADRRIIVDHKTYPGTDPVGHVIANYLGQMAVYRDALTAIDGVAPAAVLIHLPLLGTVLAVDLP